MESLSQPGIDLRFLKLDLPRVSGLKLTQDMQLGDVLPHYKTLGLDPNAPYCSSNQRLIDFKHGEGKR